MNATKFVVATVTAISMIGAITFAYAQTASPAASSSSSGMQPSTSPSAAPMESSLPSNRSNTGTTMNSDGSTMPAERNAQADRN